MPGRRCFFCAKVACKNELFRFVVKEGAVVFDRPQRLSGRGAYLCKNKECIVGGCKKGFSRVFKVTLPLLDSEELLNKLELL